MDVLTIRAGILRRQKNRKRLQVAVRAFVLVLVVLVLTLSFDGTARALTGPNEFPARGRVGIGQPITWTIIDIPNEPEDSTHALPKALVALGATYDCPDTIPECIKYVDGTGNVYLFKFNP